MTRIKIGGREFDVHNSKYADVSNLARYSGRCLLDCYDRPSTAKISIFNEWFNWSLDNDVHYFGVSSYNIFGFSLQGLVEQDGTTYILNITKTNNKAYIVG